MNKTQIKKLSGHQYTSIRIYESTSFGDPDKRQGYVAEFRLEGQTVNILMENPRRNMRIAIMTREQFKILFAPLFEELYEVKL